MCIADFGYGRRAKEAATYLSKNNVLMED